MVKKYNVLTLLLSLTFTLSVFPAKIGLLIVATGKYIDFVKPLIDSANEYFCKNHEVTYFVFTDGQPPQANTIVRLEHTILGWPYDTMMRLSVYNKYADQLCKMDYLFALDADMKFVAPVGDEILSDRVATLHPGYVGTKGTYERRKESTAYIGPTEGSHYFCGGFNGGTSKEYLKLAKTLTDNIEKDLAKNIIAIWHDESHINRYFVDNPPTLILSPSYCYPESTVATQGRKLPDIPRLIALDKVHGSLRVTK